MAQRTNRLLLLGLLLAAFFLWRKDWLLPSLTTEADIQSPESPDSAALGQQQPQAAPPAALPPPPLPHPPPPPPNEHSFKPSSHALALQGYNVFDHLYLSAGKLVYAPSPSSSSGSGPRVEPADVISEDPEARFAQVDDGETWFDALEGRDEGVRVIPGSTLLFYDGPGPGGYMTPHLHFLSEVLVPALKALALASPASAQSSAGEIGTMPRRVWIPRVEDVSGDQGWRDAEGKNVEMLEVLLGRDVELRTRAEWAKLASAGQAVVFERVVVVDRFAAHRHPLTSQWNKMNSAIATLPAPHPDWFAPYRTNAHRVLGVGLHVPNEAERPVVVYFDRNRPNTSPRLSSASHASLLSTLRSLAHLAEIHLINLPALTLAERLALLSRTRILLGARHDLEFILGTLWMKAGEGTVLEMFDTESIVRDNAIVSENLGLNHLAIQNNQLISPLAWLGHPNVRGPDLGSDSIELDPEIVARKIREVLGFE